MNITPELVKTLRDKTQAGIMDCKEALKEADGDMEKAVEHLRKKGLATAQKRAGRATSQGQIGSYIHAGGKMGVMVEVNCETDFVGRTDQFGEFVHNIAMHIAAANPVCVRREEMPSVVVEKEKEIYRAQAQETGKPDKVIEKIVEGKLDKFFKDSCLLEQGYVKNPDITITDYLNDTIAQTGESITIRRFARFVLGEEG
ncbi:MAG: translation elongation factor Ts [Desulfobacteraceae bacterium]|nr:MAG: translation elongation factor Ts [Desulfobacteraceae bacterium]RPH88798.1 MAG: translation elongation factor Ts [Desulfobacteraceae bacterium]